MLADLYSLDVQLQSKQPIECGRQLLFSSLLYVTETEQKEVMFRVPVPLSPRTEIGV